MRTLISYMSALCALLGFWTQGASARGTCSETPTESWVEVVVHGVRSNEGNMRAQIYSDDPADFLRKGKQIIRVEAPSHEGITRLCVPLPHEGKYALVVMHDRNANGRADFYTEGFGFSNNPRLSVSAPDHADTVFNALAGGKTLDVFLGYMLFGRLSPQDPQMNPGSGSQSAHESATSAPSIQPTSTDINIKEVKKN
ncbi:hypothetical protein GCM10007972_25810 [Iodidimonas muriae]|uniref:DUF2141 domain-containing protein n=1 Tax=Iodidimonas muriae TaxID=261467 RepID=A0ABQ2LG24_9PROT|nr:DUF2141 domain-containing protein [Iodidimonas muriae]GER08558.1 hypothetical protein JCM17843_28680 [Kordiimonadales bacterium JCM 17843]GGO16578.1 hypothetical protein GCM10007972_25810 [Iodidimonas muriae]